MNMIRVNELRVGNKLNRGGVMVTIDGRSIFDIWSGSDEYRPIPLTPEVLIKCGAEADDASRMWWEIDLKQNIGQIHINPSMGIIWLRHHRKPGFSMNPTSIEYLHELQNLYYALTKEELNIDL
jgi:hypothetical protein